MPNRKSQIKPVAPEIAAVAAHHGGDPKAVLEVLRDLDALHGGLTPETITGAAHALRLPANKAFGVATFYSMLSLAPRKNVLRVCDGPVCWLKRAAETRHALDALAGADPEWTLERTSCLGMCDRAPRCWSTLNKPAR